MVSKADQTHPDVIVIGAGAAGMFCAIEAAKRGRRVLLIEKNDTIGKKIRISGGGRCNFTNLHATSENFISNNPNFSKSALASYSPMDFCTLVQNHAIPFHEKKLGQLFCDGSSQEIIGMLKKECLSHGVKILTATSVTSVKKGNRFTLTTSRGKFETQGLVIATGGLSLPTLGATDFGYKIAKQFALKINPCRAGLVPLTFNAKDLKLFADLSGVSVDVIVSFKKTSFREFMLFTHRGLSGPAILQISSYWQPGNPIQINLLPKEDMFQVLQDRKNDTIYLKNFLKNHLPARLVDIFCEQSLRNQQLYRYGPKEFMKIARFLHNWEITPEGTEGYAKAEVTVGGVDTSELSSKTMEAKKIPGLYFIGEVVDVTGHLGGFNFQWAWASAFAAGQAV